MKKQQLVQLIGQVKPGELEGSGMKKQQARNPLYLFLHT